MLLEATLQAKTFSHLSTPALSDHTKFYDCRKSNARVRRRGAFLFPSPYKIGGQNTLYKLGLTLFMPRGSLGTPQRFLSITLRAFEIILWNLVTFPKIYWETR